MLKELAQEMIQTQKRTGGKVAKTLARGLTITLTDHKLSLTRDGVLPSPIEERLVLEAFGLFCCRRQARQDGKWWIISFMYFDIEKLPPKEAAWARQFAAVVNDPLPEGVLVTFGEKGKVRLVVGKPPIKQGELFSGGLNSYYE